MTPLRLHYLQHVPFESPGSILPWAATEGCGVTATRLFEGDALPSTEDFDLLVVMGGPMSVNDEADYPWLVDEKRFVRASITRDRAVLGVCLGAQVIASALGMPVYRNTEREIGWFPVQATPDAQTSPTPWPAELTVFHWHGETFDLPPGSVLLASSEGCVNQAFGLGDRIIGLQFHLEATPESVRDMVAHCRHELTPDRYVQSERDLLDTPAGRYVLPNHIMSGILRGLGQAVLQQACPERGSFL